MTLKRRNILEYTYEFNCNLNYKIVKQSLIYASVLVACGAYAVSCASGLHGSKHFLCVIVYTLLSSAVTL